MRLTLIAETILANLVVNDLSIAFIPSNSHLFSYSDIPMYPNDSIKLSNYLNTHIFVSYSRKNLYINA